VSRYRFARFIKPRSIPPECFDIGGGEKFVAVLRWLSQWFQEFCPHENLNFVRLDSQEHGGLTNI